MDDKTLNTMLDGYDTPKPSQNLNEKIMTKISDRKTSETPFIFTMMRRAVPLMGITLVVLSLYSFFYGPQVADREIAAFLNETINQEIYETEIAHALIIQESQEELEAFLLEIDLL